MITIVFTYRNRAISLVKNCIDSLANQTNKEFEVVVVNYGSNQSYTQQLLDLLQHYSFIQLINCEMVSQQLWNKSRAINIALKQCNTPYFFVADMDMIFKTNFIEKLYHYKNEREVHYFQVGFLSEEESKKTIDFSDYKVNFLSTEAATGMTLYPTNLLQEINGYNEFYHGWGAEDTDVHVRIAKLKLPVIFHQEELLILHQWHAKNYRSKSSKEPFHSQLEKINHYYLTQTKKDNTTQANLKFDWGKIPEILFYDSLENPDNIVNLSNEVNDIEAFLSSLNEKKGVFQINIERSDKQQSTRNRIKNALKKHKKKYYPMDEINDKLLLLIVSNFRNQPYQYVFSQIDETIALKISL